MTSAASIRPGVYTIAPDRPFLATLARSLIDQTGGDPLALARITVLLPTRRAVRALRETFLRLTGEGSDPGAPLLLPRLRPIGDLDPDEAGMVIEDGESPDSDAFAVPPAVPELRRRLLLTRLILDWSDRSERHTLLPGQAAALAGALARLLDAVATEEASFDRLHELAPEDLAEHWQTVLQFLELLPRAWPAELAAEGAIDAADRRNRLLRRQAQAWQQQPPSHPVIAAGLVGGIPALAELLGVIARLERGAVILPGLDRTCSPAEWAAIRSDPSHPQYLILDLLDRLDVPPDDVRDWPAAGGGGGADGAVAARVRLVAQALRPAALTHDWRQLPPAPVSVLDGFTRYECASPQDEAITVALLLRRQLETPGATAALVTPDRELARRVAAELRRWDIEIDDSAGVPLNRTPPGAFLRLVLDLAASELAPVPLLAALKHPLAAGGLAPEIFRDNARRLEQAIRGPRPAPGFAGLRDALGRKPPRDFVVRLEHCLGELPELLRADVVSVAEVTASLVAAAESLAATDAETGIARLWQGPAGETAARFCHELLDAARDFPALAGRHYPALFEALAAGAVVRPAFGLHPRLAIWGLVEARLQQADLVVLGGLNEGTWPGPAAFDPWMSRQMRSDFGIAVPERAIGLAAHDFAQACGAAEIALTRATRREGVPTVPSRWLLRLDTVLRAVGLEGALGADPEIEVAAASRDVPPAYRPRPPAEPRPHVTARPRKLSVTQIETWRRDPYAIYARYILKLKALEDLDADPGRADLGNKVHEALAAFVTTNPCALPADAEAELLRIGLNQFEELLSRPGVWAFWWPRFERIARWFIAEERTRRLHGGESAAERHGEFVIAGPAGPFTVTAIADRIDRSPTGELTIVDYKTGSVPSKTEIDEAIAVQLPLEGAIARDGDFGIAGVPTALEYWKLSGAEPAGVRFAIGDGGDPGPLIDKVVGVVTGLIERFDDPKTPYRIVPVLRWAPRFSDYRHLERREESRDDVTPLGGAS